MFLLAQKKVFCFGFLLFKGKLSVKEFEATVNSMKESDKSLLILQLLDDILALNVEEIDYETFQRLVTAESVAFPFWS